MFAPYWHAPGNVTLLAVARAGATHSRAKAVTWVHHQGWRLKVYATESPQLLLSRYFSVEHGQSIALIGGVPTTPTH